MLAITDFVALSNHMANCLSMRLSDEFFVMGREGKKRG